MLLDTFAWVEFFRGTKKGVKVKKFLIESQCFTCAISLAELNYWIMKEKLDENKIITAVKSMSAVISLDNSVLEFAGKLNYLRKQQDKNFGMVDAIILAVSKSYGLPVVTGDRHFEKEKGTIML
ncbi:MAG: PIN domain-containing protein [archaeon]